MPCTTLLVGRNASFDGSTIIARNEDSPNGQFEPKKMAVVQPGDQSRVYTSTTSHLSVQLPDNPLRYTCVPDAIAGHGVWAAAGINAANVAMNATETLTTNPRVLGADPYVEYQPKKEDVPEQPGGLGEEDFVSLVLPYIHSAREGVERLGALLAKYGTYEPNGIAFSDVDEIWWLETVGGHHWIARRVPDNAYVTMPNQLGIDHFDLADAEGPQRDYMASSDLRAWMTKHHLNLSLDAGETVGFSTEKEEHACSPDVFNPREAFGSATPNDHVYNTPRAWYMQRSLNPSDRWDGSGARYKPESDDIPWCRVPERKVTIEDVKYVLSSHYQDTAYDCYGNLGTPVTRSRYRPIGINRTSQLAVQQIRPSVSPTYQSLQWMAFGSNAFNALVPLYTNVNALPEYLCSTTGRVTSENFYWANRLIGALADACYAASERAVTDYQEKLAARGHAAIVQADAKASACSEDEVSAVLEAANESFVQIVKSETEEVLGKVLYAASCKMKNSFAMSDNERQG